MPVKSAARFDEDTLHALQPALMAFALRQVRRPDLARDLVQETLVAALESKDSFEARSHLRTWLIGILGRKIVDHYRRRRREILMDVPPEPESPSRFAPRDGGRAPESRLDHQRAMQVIERSLGTLGPAARRRRIRGWRRRNVRRGEQKAGLFAKILPTKKGRALARFTSGGLALALLGPVGGCDAPGCGANDRGAAEPTTTAKATPTPTVKKGADDAAETNTLPSHLREAVGHRARPEEDRARDEDRKPADVLAFFGIEPGMKVAEMMAGRGYYAEILARAVGPQGRVYVHNTPYVLDKFAREPLAERLQKPGLDNAVRRDRPLEDPGLPEGELDAVLMVLFYHDTYWMDVDRDAMIAAISGALRPGGVFGVVDHHAQQDAGTDHVKSLHRIEPEIVQREILEAGFELDGKSDLLRHPEDGRTTNVFDDAIRGKTDRFMFRFRKPE